jgi:hypothetical protein
MALIKKAEIHYARLDPKRPNARYNADNPTWELQLRTTDPAQAKEWTDLGLNVAPLAKGKKAVDEAGVSVAGELILDKDGKKQWRVNLQRRSKKRDGEPQTPVVVVNGHLEPVDPNTIGDGSIANVTVFQYPGKKDPTATVSMLSQVQLLKHKVYTRKPSDDDFEVMDYETIEEDHEEGDAPSAPASSGSPSIGKPAVKPILDASEY